MKCKYIFSILIPVLFASCVKEQIDRSNNVEEEIEPVNVSLEFRMASENNGTPDTKAIDDIITPPTPQIKNMCILQFRGTNADAPLVGGIHYLIDDDKVDENDRLNYSNIKLADSHGSKHTIVFLANTFGKIPPVGTLGELKELSRIVSSQENVFSYGDDSKGSGFPDDRTYYMRLNGVAVCAISSGTNIRAELQRSISRINIKIENDGKDKLVIKSILLKNVSQHDYYLTNYSYYDGETKSGELFSGGFQDNYESNPRRMDYEAVNVNSANPEGKQSQSFTWYVPANMRGTDLSNDMPELKNRSKNCNGATYVQIVGVYGPQSNKEIVYTFYLGENLVNNYDLKPNTSYSYVFKFSGIGDAAVDGRIEDLGDIDFALDANCYIANTPGYGTRSYTFNVVHRPNIFWGTPENDRYGQYKDYPSNYIGQTEKWYARILWSDFEMTQEQANAFLVRKTGNGSGDYFSNSQRVKITVPAGMEGNVVIGIYTGTNSDNILWSWHIWVTPYKPDKIIGTSPTEGKYIYYVPGGEVHRYAGELWESGNKYGNAYVLDRSIGALDQFLKVGERGNGLYYQFGRKDPFISQQYKKYIYSESGEIISELNQNTVIAYNAINYDEISGLYKNVPYSISNPMSFITSNKGWTYGDIFNPQVYEPSILWQDPLSLSEIDFSTKGISIFDPCPMGWHVPEHDFVTDLKVNINLFYNIEKDNGYNRGLGMTYYPKGDAGSLNSETIFFPYSGVLGYDSGKLGSYDMTTTGAFWKSTQAASNASRDIWMRGGGYNFNDTSNKGNGMPIRCVKL